MKKAVIIGSAVLGLLFALVAGYGFHWEHKLEPILNTPAARLAPTPFIPVHVVNTKSLNLGYERLSIPDYVRGELVHFADSNVTALAEGKSYPLSFFPPQDIHDPETIAFFRNISAFTGRHIQSRFDLQKYVLAQRPVSVWQVFSIGMHEFQVELLLLRLKSLQYSQTSIVQIFENERIGVVIHRTTDLITVDLTNRKIGLSQRILIFRTVENVDAVISALVSDYKLSLDATDEQSIARLIDSAGLKSITPKSSTSASETKRLEDSITELRRRRLLQEQMSRP